MAVGPFAEPAPRFKVGDQVTIVGPGLHNGYQGDVVDVVTGFDSIHRYHVRFSNGNSARFFGFELQLRSATGSTFEAEEPNLRKKAS
jgi:hypothetical protein